MRCFLRKKPLLLATLLTLGVTITLLTVASVSHGNPSGQMYGCPLPGKWAIAVWGGDGDAATGDALATCGEGAVAAAYWIDPETQAWLRYFDGLPEISTLSTLSPMQGVLALGAAPAPSPRPTETPTETATPTPAPLNCETSGPPVLPSPEGGQDLALAAKLLELIMQTRLNNGLAPMVEHPARTAAAQKYAEELALTCPQCDPHVGRSHEELWAEVQRRVEGAGYVNPWTPGELWAPGFMWTSAQDLCLQWMGSEEHRSIVALPDVREAGPRQMARSRVAVPG
jgi:uncharacterized protein YkwD